MNLTFETVFHSVSSPLLFNNHPRPDAKEMEAFVIESDPTVKVR